MYNNILLSICIPTTNRKRELLELVRACQKINSDRFDIIITDNGSKDGTIEALNRLNDKRVKVVENKDVLIPHLFMVKSIYNGDGSYALYCNDRDLIIPRRVENLIELLSHCEFCFISTEGKNKRNNNAVYIYDNCFESMCNQEHEHHPTGMVFNLDMIRNYIPFNKIKSFKDEKTIYYWDYLMRELFPYGKSARWNNGLWRQRSLRYLGANRSSALKQSKNTYFLPENIQYRQIKLFWHIFKSKHFEFNEDEKFYIMKRIVLKYSNLGGNYKVNIASPELTYRYGLEPKFIHLLEILKINISYLLNIRKYFLRNQYPLKWACWINRYMALSFFISVGKDFKNNLSLIKQSIFK